MKLQKIVFPSQINLAEQPTPLHALPRLSAKLGVDIFIKRDDLTGIALSGNKVRKLEFVLADALAKKADTVLTCGGAQSNHCRATAVAAAMVGLRCRLLLRTTDPMNPPPLEGNILLDKMAGAEILWITPEEYKFRDQIFEKEAAAIEKAGRKPYIIPEELVTIVDLAKTEGIYLDPVYTGKAFFGMLQELRHNPNCFGDRIIFIQTGGIFGLFPQAREIEQLLL